MERYRVRALAWSSLAIAFITASFIEESDKENELFYPLFLTGALLIGVAVLEHAYAYSQDQVYPVPADATAYQHNRIAEAMDHVEVMAGLPRSAHAVTATAQPENLALP
ncbi:MAG: hypothetical protein K0S29_945, partial [Gammaproteobacteria bacterium]|nr:hypothetical protein [Gammaproteobacteria bacterium]